MGGGDKRIDGDAAGEGDTAGAGETDGLQARTRGLTLAQISQLTVLRQQTPEEAPMSGERPGMEHIKAHLAGDGDGDACSTELSCTPNEHIFDQGPFSGFAHGNQELLTRGAGWMTQLVTPTMQVDVVPVGMKVVSPWARKPERQPLTPQVAIFLFIARARARPATCTSVRRMSMEMELFLVTLPSTIATMLRTH